LHERTFKEAIREHVPTESQRSVADALELLVKFADKHKWTGQVVPKASFKLADGSIIRLRAVGRFFSNRENKNFFLALQPRADDTPNLEQFRMWRSALHYEYIQSNLDDAEAMIVDFSRNPVNRKRELSEFSSQKLPLLSREELESRFQIVVTCFLKAIELVPNDPSRKSRGSQAQGKLF
jgi:hypothetical protein